MAILSFTCIHETTEYQPSDSPYFLVYAGDAAKHKSELKYVRRSSWDDKIDAGESGSKEVVFEDILRLDFVMVALIEEDYDPDSNFFGNVESWMRRLDVLLQPTGLAPGSEPEKILLEEFEKAIKKYLSNDDLVDLKRMTVGVSAHFRETGGKGRYRVTFTV